MALDTVNTSGTRKVLWRDGDVVSQSHFTSLEHWIEDLVGFAAARLASAGLFRMSDGQPEWNLPASIQLRQFYNSVCRVDVERLQGINKAGRLLSIEAQKTFDLRIRTTMGGAENSWVLYLRPGSPSEGSESHHTSDPVTGVQLYESPCELALDNTDDRGIPVGRFVRNGENVELDPAFVPFGVRIDSSTASIMAWESLKAKFFKWKRYIDEYMPRLLPTPDLIYAWSFATRALQLNEWTAPLIENPHAQTADAITGLRQFFNVLRGDLKIFRRELDDRPQETLKQRTADIIALMEREWAVTSPAPFDLGATLRNSEGLLDALIEYLGELPVAPDVEAAIPVSAVELTKEAGMNKLLVRFENETQFRKGKSRLRIELREFSKADPIRTVTRIGLGSAIYAQLNDIAGVLLKINNEPFTYTIDCPAEVVTRDKATQMTIYLPPPLGEGVPNLKSHIRLILRD